MIPPSWASSWGSCYRSLVKDILVYGEENDLILNRDKTKEIIMDFRKNSLPLHPLTIRRTEVEKHACNI